MTSDCKSHQVVLLTKTRLSTHSTLEALAETMQVPLYVLLADNLEAHPAQVEFSLEQISQMTTKRKIILLLEE